MFKEVIGSVFFSVCQYDDKMKAYFPETSLQCGRKLYLNFLNNGWTREKQKILRVKFGYFYKCTFGRIVEMELGGGEI